MSKKMPPFSLRDFSLGLIDSDDANLIPENALAAVQDMIPGRGFISARYGYDRYTPVALANPITKLYEMFKNNGTREFLAVSNNTLYKDDTGVLTGITMTNALTTNTVKALTYKDRSLNDVAVLADGGKLKVYNGASVSEVAPYAPTGTLGDPNYPAANDIANLTNFRAIAIKKDRMFAAAHPTVKNRISFCHRDINLGYAVYDYWPATFFYDLVSDKNDGIVTLEIFRDAVIALCDKTVWALYGDGTKLSDYDVKKLNVPGGCIAPDSVTIAGNYIFYLSDDDVYAIFSTDYNFVSAKPISKNIRNTLKAIPLADRKKAKGYFFQNRYYLSFPGGTTLIFDMNLPFGGDPLACPWYKWTNIKANSFLARDGVLYFAADTGMIYKFNGNVYSDDGTPIPWSMATKNLDNGAPASIKSYKGLRVIAKQYDVETSSYTVDAVIDYITKKVVDASTDESAVFGEWVLGESILGFKDVVYNPHKLQVKGRNIQLIAQNTGKTEPFTLYGLILLYKQKKPK